MSTIIDPTTHDPAPRTVLGMRVPVPRAPADAGPRATPARPAPSHVMLAGARVDLLDLQDAVDAIAAAAADRGATAPLGVVSANLDHLHHFGRGSRWHSAFTAAESRGRARWLTLLDGAPLVTQASSRTGRAWPRLAGSDLIEPLLDRAEADGRSVGFLGGAPETHTAVRERLARTHPSLRLAGCWAPTRAQIEDVSSSRDLAAEVRESGTDLLFVGLGKPRQELWIAEHGPETGAGVLLAFGAACDFLVGTVRRAPAVMQRSHAEWLFRLAQEPRRLARRYLVQGPVSYAGLRFERTSEEITTEGSLPRTGPAGTVSLPPQVTAVVVTYNSADSVQDLIEDLRREIPEEQRQVLVKDNGSTDATVDLVESHPDLRLHADRRNLGYAGGINAALADATYDGAVLFLNPDTRLRPGAVARMLERLAQPGVGCVVPRLLDADGGTSQSLRYEPTTRRAIGDAVLGGRWPDRPTSWTEVERMSETYAHPHPVDWATGACLMVRAEVLRDVGAWDERYFLYSEEVDYMRRIRQAGWEVWYEPSSTVVHTGHGSGTSDRLAALLAVNKVRYAHAVGGPSAAHSMHAATILAAALRPHRPAHRAMLPVLLAPRMWDMLGAEADG